MLSNEKNTSRPIMERCFLRIGSNLMSLGGGKNKILGGIAYALASAMEQQR